MKVKKHSGLVLSIAEGFTLLEILIVIGMVIVLAVILLLLFNPKQQIEKAWDAKRKQDLVTIRNLFENHYNDKMYYPQSSDVCYTGVENKDGNCYCKICASQKDNADFLSANICDPQSPSKDYLYQFDCNQAEPQWYRVCAILSNAYDIEASASAGTIYNYGVSSNNVAPENCATLVFGPGVVGETVAPTVRPTNVPGVTAIPTIVVSPTSVPTATPTINPTLSPTPNPFPTLTCLESRNIFYCLSDGICNNCGDFDNCQANCTQTVPLYSDAHCQSECN